MERNPTESSKRFSLSSEESAKEKIRAVQSTIEEMKREYPEVIGVSLFGSLVKGTATLESDIDALLLVNPDAIAPDANKGPIVHFVRYDHAVIRGGASNESTFHWPELRSDLSEKYEQIFKEKLTQKLPTLREEQSRDITVAPLSQALIGKMLDEIVDSYKKYPNGVSQQVIRLEHKIDLGEEGKFNPENIRIEPSQLLYMLFHMDVGGGLPPYRKMVLDRLSAEGILGETIWTNLISSTESWEQGGVAFDALPTEKRYPRTLAEAVGLYGSK